MPVVYQRPCHNHKAALDSAATTNDKAAQLSIKAPGHALEEALSFLLTALAIVLSYTYITIKSI